MDAGVFHDKVVTMVEVASNNSNNEVGMKINVEQVVWLGEVGEEGEEKEAGVILKVVWLANWANDLGVVKMVGNEM